MKSLVVLSMVAAIGLTSATALAANSAVDQLKTIDKTVGTGMQATPGATVTVDYTGWLYDPKAKNHHGKKFDSSRDHGQRFSFTLGEGQVIKGWDQGVEGMREGGERTLIIPAKLAYGTRGSGSIPPNTPLVFDVTLHNVEKQLPRSLNWRDAQGS